MMDCQPLLLQYMMQTKHTQEYLHNQMKPYDTLKIEEQIAARSSKRQGAGISETIRKCLGRIEDRIFQQANQIATILQDQQSIKIDGYSYSAIQQSTELSVQLQKVRMNAPVYQHMSSKKKKEFFEKLGNDYCLSLSDKKLENFQQRPLLSNEETYEISQNSIIKDRKFGKKIKKIKASKITEISELEEEIQEPKSIIENSKFKTPKKVCFLSQSSKKYFAKQEEVVTVSAQRTYLFSTLDKL